MKEQDKFPQTWEQANKDCASNHGCVLAHEGFIEKGYIYATTLDLANHKNEAAKLMAERYEARIAELENQWIPVEERLPEEKDADENGKVLIYRVTNNSQASLSKSIYDWAMVKYLEKDSHWMPLPNKPPHK